MEVIVFATGNAHKLREARSVLQDLYEVKSLADIGCDEEVPETQPDLEGNARQKARYVQDHYGLDCFAEDTGLEVEALDGAPGVFTARYAGPERDALANNQKLLHELSGKTNRRARFRAVIALVQGGSCHLFEGIVNGRISNDMRGEKGFGYDPIFIPDGHEKTFAELGDEIKNSMSHRARALKKLTDFLHNQQG